MRCIFTFIASIAVFSVSGAQLSSAEERVCGKEVAAKVQSTSFGIEVSQIDAQDPQMLRIIRGSAWLAKGRTIAGSIDHVVDAMGLSATEWKPVTLFWSVSEYAEPSQSFETTARVHSALTTDAFDDVAFIEFADALPEGITTAIFRQTPLARDEAVVGVGYTGRKLRFVTGRLAFPKPDEASQESGETIDHLPFELYDDDKTDRLAFDFGASGSAIFDCDGKVVAAVADVVTQKAGQSPPINSILNALRSLQRSGIDLSKDIDAFERGVSTPWGMYNVLAAPVTEAPSAQK